MGRASPLYERILISLVRDGQWEVDDQGRIWRSRIRTGLKAGGSHLVPCERRRVEHRLPLGYLQVRAMIGALAHAAGLFDHPEVIRALDYFGYEQWRKPGAEILPFGAGLPDEPEPS